MSETPLQNFGNPKGKVIIIDARLNGKSLSNEHIGHAFITLTESIFNNWVEGVLGITDVGDCHMEFELQEINTFEIKWKSHENAGENYWKGLATDISDIKYEKMGMQKFTLRLVSEAWMRNKLNRLKTVERGSGSEIVSKVGTQWLGTKIVPTGWSNRMQHKLIVPNWNPISVLNWVTARTLSNQSNADLVLFEKLSEDGLKLVGESVGNLLSNGGAKWTYNMSEAGTLSPGQGNEWPNDWLFTKEIGGLRFGIRSDKFDAGATGFNRNRYIKVSPITKSWSMEGIETGDEKEPPSWMKDQSQPLFTKMYQSNPYRFEDVYTGDKGDRGARDWSVSHWVSSNRFQSHSGGFVCDGHSELRLGNKIRINLPTPWYDRDHTELNLYIGEKDLLISSLTHIIDLGSTMYKQNVGFIFEPS